MQKLFNIENEHITTKYAITYHDIPFMTMEDGSSHMQIHFCQYPKHETNAMFSLVVGRYPNIHMFHW